MELGNWFYLAAAFAFIIGTVLNMLPEKENDEEESPWGFNVVKDGGVCDGGSYEGWEE